MALLCLTLPYNAICREGCSTIGVCLSSALRGTAEISIEHGFGQHWSICGTAGMNLRRFMQETSAIEKEHDNMFKGISSGSDIPTSYGSSTAGISARYWPTGNLTGTYLSAGISLSAASGTDIPIGIGYAINIWKGSGLTISCMIPLIESMNGECLHHTELKVGLRYTF